MDSAAEKGPLHLRPMPKEVEKRLRKALARENLKEAIPQINKDTLIMAATAVGTAAGAALGAAAVARPLADRILPLLEGGRETPPEIREVNETAQTLGECREVGRAFQNELGDVYMCKPSEDSEGIFWILQLPDSGVFIDDEGVSWTREDEIPGGEVEEATYSPSWWADEELYFDEELGKEVKRMCYSTSGGLGCDIRYSPTPIEP
jgi:hypothetical protein